MFEKLYWHMKWQSGALADRRQAVQDALGQRIKLNQSEIKILADRYGCSTSAIDQDILIVVGDNRYLINSRDTHAVAGANHHARQCGSSDRITKAQWLAVCKKHKNRCTRCGCKKPLTIDHIIPFSKGGRNIIENIQPLCRWCNQSKSDKIE